MARPRAKSPARARPKKTSAWEAYAAGSEVDHFAEFCAEHLVQWVDVWDGMPLVLEAWQLEMMGEALAFDVDGWPVWNSVVIVLPRKNAKTTTLSALADYRLLTSDGSPEILLAAASDKQAGRLFDGCATFIRKSPLLSSLVRVRDYVGEIVREDGLGKILRMSNEAGTLHGYNPSLVICDELHAWITPKLRRAWEALTTGGGARRAPQTFTITTPGEAKDRHAPILGSMLDRAFQRGELEQRPGLTIARVWDARMLVYCFEAPVTEQLVARLDQGKLTKSDLKVVKLANPASWIDDRYLARQAANPELGTAAFLQLHAGVWAAGLTSWLPAGKWDALTAHPGWKPAPGTPVVLAFDGSYNNDSTALVGCTIPKDGELPRLFVAGCWEKPQGARDWLVPRADVDRTVHEAMATWKVRELACDPPGWHQEIDAWAERYGDEVVVKFETNKRSLMVPACSRFYTAVVTGQVEHDGNPDLARHLGNAHVKETPDGAYITKDGRGSPRKIDLAVGAVIAFDRASVQDRPSVYERRGPILIGMDGDLEGL